MVKKYFALTSIVATVLLSAVLAVGQPREEESTAGDEEDLQLGENFAVTLVVEPAGVKESFTIVTATEHFLVETEVGKGEERIGLQFEGRIVMRESQMIVGERRLSGGKPILVRYRIKMRGVDKERGGGFAFGLEGSAFLEENKEVVIATTKDMTLKLRINSV